MSCESIFSCAPVRESFSLRRASICASASGLMAPCCAVAPAPGTPFENSHPARLNPPTEKIISVEVNNQRITRRRFNCFCVVKVARLDLAFLSILNIVVGYSFVADAKILSLITERGFIEDLYWGIQIMSLLNVHATMTTIEDVCSAGEI